MYILEVSSSCPSEKYPIYGIFQFDQAKALADHGHKVVFSAVSMSSIRRWRRWGVYIHKKDGIPVFEFNFPMGPILPNVRLHIAKLGFELLLEKIIKTHGTPDIVHAHFADVAMYVVAACKKAGIPYVVTEHASWVNRDDLPQAYVEELKYVYGNATKVIAVSKSLADRIQRHTGITAEVIPNIVDTAVLSPASRAERTSRFTFLSAGMLLPDQRKGFDILISAFPKVIAAYPDSRLIIMGDGPALKSLQAQADALGLHDNVEFFGAYIREEFARKLNESDVFVLASRGETFGVVCIEAMACGLPVITTRCGGPEDYITSNVGMLVDTEDVEGLTNAMLQMIANKDAYCPESISQYACCLFSSEAVANQLSGLFDSLLSKGNIGGCSG